MNENLQSAMRRAQKLLAIAADTRANPHEAAAAARQAENLMRKFSLDHADVMRAEFNRQENFSTADAACVMKKGKGHRPRVVPPWAQWLAVMCARLHGCEVSTAFNPELGACIRFFGYHADVQVCAWTYDYLTTTTIRACRAFQKEATRTKLESESYRRGYVLTITGLLDSAIAIAEKAQERAAASTARSLMVVKQAAIAERFGEFTYKKAKPTEIRDASAYVRGRRDAANVDVSRRALDAAPATEKPLLH